MTRVSGTRPWNDVYRDRRTGYPPYPLSKQFFAVLALSKRARIN